MEATEKRRQAVARARSKHVPRIAEADRDKLEEQTASLRRQGEEVSKHGSLETQVMRSDTKDQEVKQAMVCEGVDFDIKLPD